ncbi:hypothetical protein CLOM_g11949, partial [Closterium sp. NIES-68]
MQLACHADLSYNSFSGTVPSFGTLTALTYLNMSYNGLSGSLPDCFGSLSNLADLQLRRNKFTKEIPASISSLVKLSALDLFSNSFTGTIPSFGTLTALTYLNMGSNRLAGSIPDCFGKLSRLAILYLSFNRLTGWLPTSLNSLGALKLFGVHQNYLFGTDLPFRVCSLNESQVIVDTNCFTSPCNFAQEQREESDCTATCGLVPPSTLPCGGRGYCNWDVDRSQAKCACDAGSAYMTDHAACVTSTGTPWHTSQ